MLCRCYCFDIGGRYIHLPQPKGGYVQRSANGKGNFKSFCPLIWSDLIWSHRIDLCCRMNQTYPAPHWHWTVRDQFIWSNRKPVDVSVPFGVLNSNRKRLRWKYSRYKTRIRGNLNRKSLRYWCDSTRRRRTALTKNFSFNLAAPDEAFQHFGIHWRWEAFGIVRILANHCVPQSGIVVRLFEGAYRHMVGTMQNCRIDGPRSNASARRNSSVEQRRWPETGRSTSRFQK